MIGHFVLLKENNNKKQEPNGTETLQTRKDFLSM
jgi:hypothetical protein